MNYLTVLVLFFSVTVHAEADNFSRLTADFSPGFSPDTSQTEGGLWMIMTDFEETAKNSPSRINDEGLNAYIKSVICKLSEQYCNDIRLHIIRKPFFNATMAPNGMMQVWSGLLLRMRNEAQLATVLGHEIGHYLKKHSLKNFNDQITKSTILTFFSLGIAGSVAAGGVNADVGRAAVDVAQFGVIASLFAHNRDSEKEADKYAIQLLNDAKLDINEAPKIWKNLIEENEAGDEDVSSGIVFFSTHPDPGERITKLENHIQGIGKLEDTYSDNNHDEYWDNVGPFMSTFLEDELKLRQFDQTEYLLKHLISDNIKPAMTYYFLGELYRLRKKEGDRTLSLFNYNKSIEIDNHPAEAHRSIGLIYYKDKNNEMAKQHFNKYLELMPEANDKEMIEFYINFGA